MNRNKMLAYDYCSGKQLDLYVATPPAPPAPHSVNLFGAAMGEHNDYERLGRCYLNNEPLPSTKPTFRIVLNHHLLGAIRPHITHIWVVDRFFPEDHSQPPEKLVAKFYDPLYSNNDYEDQWLDVKRSIINEYESYSRLSGMPSGSIPKYRGFFLAAFPLHKDERPKKHVEPPASRNVWVMLMDFMSGTPLDKFKADALEALPRNLIMDGVIRLYSHAKAAGVQHNDPVPRNFMLRDDQDGEGVKVSMYDFEVVEFSEEGDETDGEKRKESEDEAEKLQKIQDEVRCGIVFSEGSDWDDAKWLDFADEM